MQKIPHCDNRKDAVRRHQKKIHKEMQTNMKIADELIKQLKGE